MGRQMLLRSAMLALVVGILIVGTSCSSDESAPAQASQSAPPPEAAQPAPQNASPQSVDTAAIEKADQQAAKEAQQVFDLPDIRDVKWTGDFDGMVKRRLIRVLTTYSKINYFVDQARPRGLVYDAFRQFEDDLNARLKTNNLRVHVLFIAVPHDQLVPALLAGRGDIVAAGTLLLDWKREQVDFTNPTRSNVSSIIVSGPGVPPVASTADLAGRQVYLRMSDVSKQNVERFNAELTKAGKAPVKIIAAPEVLADEDILEMVNAGLVPMTMTEDYIAEFWQKVFPKLVVNRGAAVRTNVQTGMLVRKNSPLLLKELNAFIAKYPEGSLLRNVLLREYLGSLKYAKDATSEAERAKFERLVSFFRRYGDKYDIDFLLMAAQGYQESRLDHSAKSAVGAIGVMQVMPATGKELAVGDIKEIEPNIHAGVKYMRTMMDRYFGNEKMTPLDKALFTFASYNAGPNRIRDLRARAAKRGLDPNVWFNNVEVVVAESIGRETVQYVSNIYKYYLAYKLLSDQRDQRRQALEQKPSS